MYFFLFFLLCSSPAFCLEMDSECPSVLVYDEEGTELYESNLLTHPQLVVKVGLSVVHGLSENSVRAYPSLGLSPQVQLCSSGSFNSTRDLNVAWRQNENMWTVSVDTTACAFECCVSITLQSLDSGCGTLEWVGYFLEVSQAPLLQWLSQLHQNHSLTLSTSMSPDTLIRHLQCSLQVAVVIADNELSYTTIYFNHAIDVSYSICSLAGLSTIECANLLVIDVALTHYALMLLTSAGLYVSDTVSGQLIQQEVPFIMQGASFMEQNSLFCQDLILSNEILQVISSSADSVLVYSALPPYTNWTAQSTLCSGGCTQLFAAYDSQISRFITATIGNDSMVRISEDEVLGNVSVSHMFYHPTSASVYLLGSQVWISVDDGATFTSLLELSSPVISYSHNDQALLLLTASGQMYLSRPGTLLPTLLEPLSNNNLTIHNLTRISLGRSNYFWRIDLINKVVGPCTLEYDNVNARLLHLHDESLNCNAADLVGYRADEESIGRGLVSGSFGEDILIAMRNPVNVGGVDGEWMFEQEQCWTYLSTVAGFNTATHELDVWDTVELQVVASTSESQRLPRHFLDITVTLGHPELFDVMTMSLYTPTTHTLTVLLWQKYTTHFPVHSSVRISLVHCSSLCEDCALIFLIRTSCPSSKELQFIYPFRQSGNQRYTLPINYRPPSALGVAIHSSPHVYNADPTTLTQSPFSDVNAQLKQCLHKSSRYECECTESQYTTSDITTSDCIGAVYRQLYEVVFPLNFSLLLTMDGLRGNASFIELEELNQRSDFILITNNSQVSAIRFKGPGLFHFRALLVNITSFCQLSTQFTVFVERAPLPKAVELTVTTLTTIVFGLLTFIGYLIHYYLQDNRKYKQKHKQITTTAQN
ncbi:uncharacterized protein LOC135349399 isoform X2 [Halichondria panicea]|uniref:uncharacterized protein LOC135349399 isoform X2 n=1 Tax=Halichondria panicea TaxID=6063 RepID=UPI00312B9065